PHRRWLDHRDGARDGRRGRCRRRGRAVLPALPEREGRHRVPLPAPLHAGDGHRGDGHQLRRLRHEAGGLIQERFETPKGRSEVEMDAKIAAVKIPRERVDGPKGKVRVYDRVTGKPRDVYPIDAREQIAYGSAVLDRPEEVPLPAAIPQA